MLVRTARVTGPSNCECIISHCIESNQRERETEREMKIVTADLRCKCGERERGISAIELNTAWVGSGCLLFPTLCLCSHGETQREMRLTFYYLIDDLHARWYTVICELTVCESGSAICLRPVRAVRSPITVDQEWVIIALMNIMKQGLSVMLLWIGTERGEKKRRAVGKSGRWKWFAVDTKG